MLRRLCLHPLPCLAGRIGRRKSHAPLETYNGHPVPSGGRPAHTYSKPIRALAVLAGSVYAGFGDGVRCLESDGRWAATRGGPQEYVERMRTINDKLFVFTKKALHHFDDARWTQIGTGHHVDIVAFAEKLVVTTSRSLFEFREGALHPLPGGEVSPGPIQPLGNYSETLYCLGYDRLFTFDGRDFDHKNVALQGRRSGFIPAWGNAPGFWM